MIDFQNRRHDPRIAVATALALFSLYVAGACRTIYVGDSGELVTAVHVLGIPHPSGYPLYVLLGKLWTLVVPIGSIAFRMSLFSAACAAATCALVYTVVRRDGGSHGAGLLGAGLLAFAPSFWQEANIQRVYALNALFVVLALDRAFAWYRIRRPRDLVMTMLICGVGATNHTVMALVGLAVAVWAPIVEPSLWRKVRVVAACAGAFFAGLSVYLYLPLRARMNPALNWGEPTTLERALDVVLRRDFWPRAWWQSPADLVPIATDFAKSLGPETGFAGVVLGLVAVVVRPDRKWLLPALVILLNVAALARHGSYQDIFVWHRYYIPAYAMVAVLAAAGLDALRARVPRLPAWVALAVPLVMAVSGWKDADRSRHRFADDFAMQVLDSLPPGARLLTSDDNVLFVQLYMKYVEGRRPDVVLVAEGVDQRKSNVVFNPDLDAVFWTHYPSWRMDGLELAPRGVVFQAVRAGKEFPPPIDLPPLPGLDDTTIPRDYLTRSLIAHYWFMQAMTWEYRDWSRAETALAKVVAAAPDQELSHINTGLMWERNGFYGRAIAAFEQAGRINPRGIFLGVDRATGDARRLRPLERASAAGVERDRVLAIERSLATQFAAGHPPGSSSWHRALAAALASRGERAGARYHSIASENPLGSIR